MISAFPQNIFNAKTLDHPMRKLIQRILTRNSRVEQDKAWEVSKSRRTIIALITYAFAVLFLMMIDAPQPWLTALVPSAGFLLSTLTLPLAKKWWVHKIYKK